MKRMDIEKSIRRSVNKAPSLDFEKLCRMPVEKMSEHDYITRQQDVQSTHHLKKLTAAACYMAILICFAYWFFQYRMPSSTIALDAQSSIEIVVNRKNQVLRIRTLNEDYKKITEELDLKNTDVVQAAKNVLDSMVRLGLLKNSTRTIMLSVENSNIESAKELLLVVGSSIQDDLDEKGLSLEILSRSFVKDEKTSELAEQYSISSGKVNLIENILYLNGSSYSVESLSKMSIDELVEMNNNGSNSSKQYDNISAPDKGKTEFIDVADNTTTGNMSETDNSNIISFIPSENENLTDKTAVHEEIIIDDAEESKDYSVHEEAENISGNYPHEEEISSGNYTGEDNAVIPPSVIIVPEDNLPEEPPEEIKTKNNNSEKALNKQTNGKKEKNNKNKAENNNNNNNNKSVNLNL